MTPKPTAITVSIQHDPGAPYDQGEFMILPEAREDYTTIFGTTGAGKMANGTCIISMAVAAAGTAADLTGCVNVHARTTFRSADCPPGVVAIACDQGQARDGNLNASISFMITDSALSAGMPRSEPWWRVSSSGTRTFTTRRGDGFTVHLTKIFELPVPGVPSDSGTAGTVEHITSGIGRFANARDILHIDTDSADFGGGPSDFPVV